MPFGLKGEPLSLRSPDVSTRRLEAFSYGVFAIAITLLALTFRGAGVGRHHAAGVGRGTGGEVAGISQLLAQFHPLLIAWVYHHRLLQGTHRAGTRLLF